MGITRSVEGELKESSGRKRDASRWLRVWKNPTFGRYSSAQRRASATLILLHPPRFWIEPKGSVRFKHEKKKKKLTAEVNTKKTHADCPCKTVSCCHAIRPGMHIGVGKQVLVFDALRPLKWSQRCGCVSRCEPSTKSGKFVLFVQRPVFHCRGSVENLPRYLLN